MQHGLHESHASSYLRTMERGSAPNVRKQVWVGRSERTMTAPFKASGPGAPQLSWSSRIVAELGQLNPGGESPPNAIVRGGARRGKAPGSMLYFFFALAASGRCVATDVQPPARGTCGGHDSLVPPVRILPSDRCSREGLCVGFISAAQRFVPGTFLVKSAQLSTGARRKSTKTRHGSSLPPNLCNPLTILLPPSTGLIVISSPLAI
jgi:hypothetical protein